MEASLKWTASRPRQMQQLVRIAGSASCWRRTRYLWRWRTRTRGEGGGGVLPIRADCQPCTRPLPHWLPHHISSPVSLSMYFFNCMHSVPCTHTHTHTHAHTHFSILLLFVFSDSRGARRRVAFSVNSRRIGVTSTKPVQIWVKGVRKKVGHRVKVSGFS